MKRDEKMKYSEFQVRLRRKLRHQGWGELVYRET